MNIPTPLPPSGPPRGQPRKILIVDDAGPQPPKSLYTRGKDIPAHFHLYRLYMMVPQNPAHAMMTGDAIRVEGLVEWEFGRVPAASPLHARDIYWANCQHQGPALVSAVGVVVNKRKIRKEEILVQQVAFEGEEPLSLPDSEKHRPTVE